MPGNHLFKNSSFLNGCREHNNVQSFFSIAVNKMLPPADFTYGKCCALNGKTYNNRNSTYNIEKNN